MIEVREARKHYGPVRALGGVSLAIAPGERVALVGTNGSGKTTLMRAICGLLRIEGQVQIDGFDVVKQPERALRSLAYMPQSAPPLDAPVGELVRAYCALRGSSAARAAACARRLGLTLEESLRTRVRDLSGGMKQKLLAALALSSEAPILVCDEPTASLDAASRAAFFELVQARPASTTLLLCSHRVDEVRQLVQRVVELKDGQIVYDGASSETLRRVPVSSIELWRAS